VPRRRRDWRAPKRIGCDFIVLGPVARTATHPDARAAGLGGFAPCARQVPLPIYAIGGLGRDDLAHRARTRRAGHRRDPRVLAR
jgi:8-oxo-dGTP diphosphatase